MNSTHFGLLFLRDPTMSIAGDGLRPEFLFGYPHAHNLFGSVANDLYYPVLFGLRCTGAGAREEPHHEDRSGCAPGEGQAICTQLPVAGSGENVPSGATARRAAPGSRQRKHGRAAAVVS